MEYSYKDALLTIAAKTTHANHKYEVCGRCLAQRALGLNVEDDHRTLPPLRRLGRREQQVIIEHIERDEC